MNTFNLILREFIGMFIDDEFLALAVLAVVGIAAALSFLLNTSSTVTGAVLVVGCFGVLVSSVLKAGWKRR